MTLENNQNGLTIMCDQWLELLDELSIGSFTVGFDRKISSMNYTAQALMGLKENEVIGQDCREIFTGVPCMTRCLIKGNDELTLDEPEIEIQNEDVSEIVAVFDSICKKILSTSASLREA